MHQRASHQMMFAKELWQHAIWRLLVKVKANYELTVNELDQFAILGQKEQQMLKMAQSKLNLSARSYHRILRVARTIADLAASEHIKTAHVAEALSYR